MKTPLALMLALGYFYATVASAQCNDFYRMIHNEKMIYELSDRNGNVRLRVNQWFRSVRTSAVAAQGILARQLVDTNTNKVIHTSETIWDCTDGTVYFIVDRVHPELHRDEAQQAGTTTEISGDRMDLPWHLEPGQRLKDLSYQVKTNYKGGSHRQRYSITERRVVAREQITTAAGTFDCYKLSYVTTSGRKAKEINRSNAWFAKGVGLVRGEHFNGKGQLAELQVLTRVENPSAQ